MDVFGYAGLHELARGATAVVYELGEDRVLKLFNEGYHHPSARREFLNAQVVCDLGVPAARAFTFLEDEKRVGIVYERLDGVSMLTALLSGGDAREIIRDFARLHKRFLSAKAADVPSLKDRWRESAVRGGAGEYAQLIDLLPDGDCLCHGDYHPDNVILTRDGPRAIDFMNVCGGSALCDVARTIYLVEVAPAQGISQEFRHALAEEYLLEMGVARRDLEPCLPAVMAMRMGEMRPKEEMEFICSELSKVRFC